AHVDLPKFLERLVVIGDNGAVEQRRYDDAAGGGQHAAMVGIGVLLAHLHFAGRRIDHDEPTGNARLVDIAAAAELSLHVRGRIRNDIGAALVAGDVEEPGLLAIGGWPEIGAAVHVRTGILHLVGAALPVQREALHVLVAVVVNRLAGLRSNAFGPAPLAGILDGAEELAVLPVERVVETVAVGVDQELAVLAVDPAVDNDLRAGGVIVAVVVRGVLEVPLDLAGRGIEGDRAVGEEIVARPIRGIVARRRVAGAPIGEVRRRIVGAGDVERAAPGPPSVDLILPSLAAGLAGGRDHERFPLLFAGLGIEPGEPGTHS